jgi:pyruvate dehydrogenase E1 component beta subunit
VAFDQILNNAANLRYMSGGLVNVPIVIRGPANGGTGVGATHSHSPENILASHPGVKVVCPAIAFDAKGLLKSAIRDNDPVMFLENTILYNDKGEVPAGDYLVPLGLADVKRAGTDLTIVAHGRAVINSLKAAQLLEAEHDVSVEVVDLRSIRPLDEETILASVRKTNRALLVEENKPFCGVGAQLAYLIQDQAFDYLDAPVKRLSAIDAPAIYSAPLEKEQLPNPQRIVEAVLGML